ncbi:dihydropteroate synthase [Candidatus Woesearchaeota archaeon]|nr:dihydropteroate synthase [Candidatus Woesearchaeota archaeon]
MAVILRNKDKNKKERKVKLMGIVNLTADSFYDGGKYIPVESAIEHAIQLIEDGADILDFGAESSRPGAVSITAEQELERLLPVIKAIKQYIVDNQLPVLISVDTCKTIVAEECLKIGADIINDIAGLSDSAMAKIIAKYDASVVIMHMQGTPQTMQVNPKYEDIVAEIKRFLAERAMLAKKAGIKQQNIILDPGIGFGKTVEHNLEIIRNLDVFVSLGYPVLLGVSRKSFIGKITGADAQERLAGTIAMNTIALLQGVSYLRVHDVKEHKQVAQIVEEL